MMETRFAKEFEGKEIDPLSLSYFLYFNNKLALISDHAQGYTARLVREILRIDCENKIEEAANQYAMLAAKQSALDAGTTIGLGGGKYATAAGEVFHRPVPLQSNCRARSRTLINAMTHSLFASTRQIKNGSSFWKEPAGKICGSTVCPLRRCSLLKKFDSSWSPSLTGLWPRPLRCRALSTSLLATKTSMEGGSMVTPSLVDTDPPKALDNVNVRLKWDAAFTLPRLTLQEEESTDLFLYRDSRIQIHSVRQDVAPLVKIWID